jgi:hypothetical protein
LETKLVVNRFTKSLELKGIAQGKKAWLKLATKKNLMVAKSNNGSNDHLRAQHRCICRSNGTILEVVVRHM